MAIAPNTKEMFDILEPITLPIAKSWYPFNADCRVTKNSGKDVASDIIVKPMIMLLIFNFLDKEIEEFTNSCVPMNNNTIETRSWAKIKYIK